MLSEFKNFTAARLQLEDLVALEAYGHGLRLAYERLQVDEPQYVDMQLKSLRREIRTRVADKLEARKKEVQRSLDSLKTPTQRKQELQKELAELEKATKE